MPHCHNLHTGSRSEALDTNRKVPSDSDMLTDKDISPQLGDSVVSSDTRQEMHSHVQTSLLFTLSSASFQSKGRPNSSILKEQDTKM